MTLDFSDFIEYKNKFQDMNKEFKWFLKGFIMELGYKWLANTKARTPVDTGLLRASFEVGEYKADDNHAEVSMFNNVDYASHVEFGTPARPNWKWAAGAHMMTISMNEILEQMQDLFDVAFTQFLKQKGLM